MKKKILTLILITALALALASGLAACSSITEVVVTSSSPSSTYIIGGNPVKLTAEVKGGGKPSQEVTWSFTPVEGTTATATGAAISDDGEFTATVVGEYTVKATSKADKSKSGTLVMKANEMPAAEEVRTGYYAGSYKATVESVTFYYGVSICFDEDEDTFVLDIGRVSSAGEELSVSYEGEYELNRADNPQLNNHTYDISYTAYANKSLTTLNAAPTELTLELHSIIGIILSSNLQIYGTEAEGRIAGNGIMLMPCGPASEQATVAGAAVTEAYAGGFNTSVSMAGAAINFYYGASLRLYNNGSFVMDIARVSGVGCDYVSYKGTYTKIGDKLKITYTPYTNIEEKTLHTEQKTFEFTANASTGIIEGFKPALYEGTNGGVVGSSSISENGIILMRTK